MADVYVMRADGTTRATTDPRLLRAKDGDGQRLVEALRSADDRASHAASDAISKGVKGVQTAVPLTPEMLSAVRSALESSQGHPGLDELRQKLARTTAAPPS